METPFKRAKRLRREMSRTEHSVWSVLRGRGLGGWKFRRQVPIGPYIVDFLCVERRLVLEIDGRSHDRRVGYDRQRENFLIEGGYSVVRITNEQVFKDLEAAMRYVLAALERVR